MKILLLEDELHLRKNIKKYFTLKGYIVDDYENGEELLANSNPSDYDCMILDVNTPEIDGFEVLEYIRNNDVKTPALYISALTDTQKVLKAFELGAGDYLKKPFDLLELEARMLRISAVKQKDARVFIDSLFSYDIDARELYKGDNVCPLSATQKRFLYLLVKNKNSLVTFAMLLDYVWDGKDISHSTILSTLRNLKTIFEGEYIKNVKGEGYILEL